jgi:ankyrin repeat protein
VPVEETEPHVSPKPHIHTDTGNETVVRHLLDKHASVDAQVKDTGWSALMYAACNGHVNVVQV